MTGKTSLLLAIGALVLTAGTGLMWHLMPGSGAFAPEDLKIGQSRAEAETAFAGQGFFGRTCFGELAVFSDREEKGREQHVMALLNETTKRVVAIEVQQVETPVSSSAQCRKMVSAWAEKLQSAKTWLSVRPSKYSAGATQRYFLRAAAPDGLMHEVWGEHKGAAGFQTCDLYRRISKPGREQLSPEGEWHLPGDQSVPFDPQKIAQSTQNTNALR